MLLTVSILFILAGYGLLLMASPDDYQKAVGMALTGIVLSIAGGGLLVMYLFRKIMRR